MIRKAGVGSVIILTRVRYIRAEKTDRDYRPIGKAGDQLRILGFDTEAGLVQVELLSAEVEFWLKMSDFNVVWAVDD